MADIGIFQFCRQDTLEVELMPFDEVTAEDFALSRGVSFGQGLFETLAVYGKKIILEDAHFARMQNGASILQLEFDLTLAKSQIALFLKDKQGTGALKITLLAGQSAPSQPRGYGAVGLSPSLLVVQFSSLPPIQISQRLCRIPEPCFPWPSALVGLKLTSAVQYVHWASYAFHKGADQGVLFDQHGLLLECTSSNIVMSDRSGQWVTPSMENAGVKGVLRQKLIDSGVVFVKDLLESDLCEASHVYVINSLRGCQRVLHYEGLNCSQSWDQSTLDENTKSFETYVKSIFTPS